MDRLYYGEIQELATAVGYYPQFVLASSLNNMIDLASMGLIGQKAGFSSSLDTQLKAVSFYTLFLLGIEVAQERRKAKLSSFFRMILI